MAKGKKKDKNSKRFSGAPLGFSEWTPEEQKVHRELAYLRSVPRYHRPSRHKPRMPESGFASLHETEKERWRKLQKSGNENSSKVRKDKVDS